MSNPTSSQRVGFWLLLGLSSTAFAEVLFPTTAFDPATMVLFAVPIYLLHSVVLAAPVLGVIGAPLALPVFLSYYVVAVVVSAASLGAVAFALRS